MIRPLKWIRDLLFQNLGWKLLSLAIAVVIWALVATEPELATFANVRLEYKNLPEGLEIIRDDPQMGYRFRYNWGSPHPRAANFLMADGSIRTLAYTTGDKIVLALLTHKGGEPLPAEF